MNRDSESDWSLFGDWQRVASLVIAIAYLLVSPILFPVNSWSHLMADIIVRILSLAFPLACIWFGDDLAEYYQHTGWKSLQIHTGFLLGHELNIFAASPWIDYNSHRGALMSLVIEEKEIDSLAITIDPEVLSGTPVFRGTRVPVDALLSNIEAGLTVDEFLENFPTVTREQALQVLGFSRSTLQRLAQSK